MSIVVNHVVRQKANALSAGIAIVRRILEEHEFPNGFRTKQMYELTQKYPPPPNFEPMKNPPPQFRQQTVPRPDHPVRSVTFLKTMILPALEGRHEIRTVAQPSSGLHSPPDLSNLRPVKQQRRNALAKEFVWMVIPPAERPKLGTVPEGKKVVGAEVGVVADMSHLNKRRQRARVTKVTEAVLKLKGRLPFSKELNEIASTPLK